MPPGLRLRPTPRAASRQDSGIRVWEDEFPGLEYRWFPDDPVAIQEGPAGDNVSTNEPTGSGYEPQQNINNNVAAYVCATVARRAFASAQDPENELALCICEEARVDGRSYEAS